MVGAGVHLVFIFTKIRAEHYGFRHETVPRSSGASGPGSPEDVVGESYGSVTAHPPAPGELVSLSE